MPLSWAYFVTEEAFLADVYPNGIVTWPENSRKIIKNKPVLYLGLIVRDKERWIRALIDEQVFICYSGEFGVIFKNSKS